jgi:hypothetical protein
MRTRWIVAPAAALAIAACAQQYPQRYTQSADGTVSLSPTRWTASLTAPEAAAPAPLPADGVKPDTVAGATAASRDSAAVGLTGPRALIGSAVIIPGVDAAMSTVATIMLANGTPGVSYPWHVHRGKCGHDEGVVGPDVSYTPIAIGADGRGRAAVTLPVAMPTDGSYFIHVHLAEGGMETTLACGNLALTGPAPRR